MRKALLSILVLLSAGSRSAESETVIEIGSRKQLFLDEYLIESLSNTVFALNPAVKVADNPVIRRDSPWEGNYIHYGTVFYDSAQEQFRMWYVSANYTPVTGDVPTNSDPIVCYATSKDGYHWTKPSLGLVAFQGSKQNNILDTKSWLSFKGGILQDLHEKDPSKRYKGMVQTLAGGAVSPSTRESGMRFDLYYSADGFRWTPFPNNPVIDWGARKGRWGPTTVMGWDPVSRRYVAHMEICAHQHCPMGKRIIGRAESPDMIHWTEAAPVIVPDSADGPDTEFYALFAIPYEGFNIGMLWNFRTTNTTIWPQFVYSRDGVHYDRRFRQPFIPLDAGHGFDSAAIYALQPIVYGDKVFVYYGGVNWRSPEQLEQLGEERAHGAIGLAVVPRDGYVSLDGAKAVDSEMVTRTFTFVGRELQVNMRAAFQRWGANPCDVRFEIQGPDYKPLPGFALMMPILSLRRE